MPRRNTPDKPRRPSKKWKKRQRKAIAQGRIPQAVPAATTFLDRH